MLDPLSTKSLVLFFPLFIFSDHFPQANNAYVWGETDRIVREWTSTIDNGASEITVDLMRDLTKVCHEERKMIFSPT